MDMTNPTEHDDAHLDELLGAYALDALDPDEAAAVEAYLAREPRAAVEVEQLRTAAAWIGASEALAPPPSLRDAVLGAARSRNGSTDEPLHAYLTETDRFDAIVDEVPSGAFGRSTPNGLDIRELVIHLASMESLLAATIGEPTQPDVDETDIDLRTAIFIERYRDRGIDAAREVWRRSIDAVRRWAIDPANASADVACFGLVLSRDSLLLARSFETWTHADDIRRAMDRRLAPPEPSTLHRMAHMSVTATPIGLEVIGRAHRGKSARVVLTGPGGGSWLIPLGHSEAIEPPDVLLTLDTVDWCLLVAERITPESVPYEAEGEVGLVGDLAAAASAFATL